MNNGYRQGMKGELRESFIIPRLITFVLIPIYFASIYMRIHGITFDLLNFN